MGLQKIQQLRETIKKFGNFESATVGNPPAAAALKQIPFQLAIMHAKIADPTSVAREGEVAAAQKYMLPTGFWTTNDATLAYLDGLEKTFQGYSKSRKSAQKKPAAETQPSPAGAPPTAAPETYRHSDGQDYPIRTIRGQRGVVIGSKFYPIQ